MANVVASYIKIKNKKEIKMIEIKKPTRKNYGKYLKEAIEIETELAKTRENLQEEHLDMLYNIQSAYLKIERQIVEEHKHEYPEYLKLLEQREQYSKKRIVYDDKISNLEQKLNKLYNKHSAERELRGIEQHLLKLQEQEGKEADIKMLKKRAEYLSTQI